MKPFCNCFITYPQSILVGHFILITLFSDQRLGKFHFTFNTFSHFQYLSFQHIFTYFSHWFWMILCEKIHICSPRTCVRFEKILSCSRIKPELPITHDTYWQNIYNFIIVPFFLILTNWLEIIFRNYRLSSLMSTLFPLWILHHNVCHDEPSVDVLI